MNPRMVRHIFRKELIDTLRDRRTLVAMLVVPLLLYPAMFILGVQVAIMQTAEIKESVSRVAVTGADTGVFRNWAGTLDKVEVVDAEDAEAALRSGRVDAVIDAAEGARDAINEGGTARVTIRYDATETRSMRAASRVAEGLEDQSDLLLGLRLEQAGLPHAYVEPIAVARENVAPPQKMTGSLLGMILPLLMVAMVGIGAFYPAIDITAGEKERGTFETLFSTPAAKLDIVAGKFLTVSLLAVVTGLLNLGSMSLTFAAQLAMLPEEMKETFQFSFPPQTLALMVVTLVPLALFIAAVMMSVAVFARNFREAQNYLVPFFLLILFPAGYASMPGVELNQFTRVVPITNVCLLFRYLMTGPVPPEEVFAVFISTAAYAMLALVFATWIFQHEEIVLSEDQGVPLTLRRAEITPSPRPAPGYALMVFAVCLLLLFYVGSYVQNRWPLPGILATQWLLILPPPLLAAWYARLDFRTTFSWRMPSPVAFGLSLAIMALWFVLSIQLSAWHNRVVAAPPELEQQMRELILGVKEQVGLGGMLAALALSPAICEEVLFRGFVLASLRKRLPLVAGCVVTGVLFGLMHLSLYRIALTGLTGVVLAFLVWRTGSLVCGMAGHFLFNATALLLATGALGVWAPVEALLRVAEERGTLPLPVLLPAVLAFAALAAVVEWRGRRVWSVEPVPADGGEDVSG